MNNYYVYIYWRLDINEPFYIGKGKDNRWKMLNKRNKHFKNIENKHLVVCEIIKDNLTEEQALGIECWLINELVFEYGYSIDIPNNRSSEKGHHLVNQTWGGEGTSGMNPYDMVDEEKREEWKRKLSKKGEDHPMYGRHHSEETRKKMSENHWDCSGENAYWYGKHLPKETRRKISDTIKDLFKDKENHPMYGKNQTDETKERIGEKAKERLKNEKNHPMYGKTHSEESKRKMSESHKGKNKGMDNPKSMSVICLTTKRLFRNIREASAYYNCHHISDCCRKKRNCAGKLPDGTPLVWKYLVWKHNKKYRIKK